MLHIEKNDHSSSTICKKSQVDIFKIMPTLRSKKWIIIKKHPVYITLCIFQILELIMDSNGTEVNGQELDVKPEVKKEFQPDFQVKEEQDGEGIKYKLLVSVLMQCTYTDVVNIPKLQKEFKLIP